MKETSIINTYLFSIIFDDLKFNHIYISALYVVLCMGYNTVNFFKANRDHKSSIFLDIWSEWPNKNIYIYNYANITNITTECNDKKTLKYYSKESMLKYFVNIFVWQLWLFIQKNMRPMISVGFNEIHCMLIYKLNKICHTLTRIAIHNDQIVANTCGKIQWC